MIILVVIIMTAWIAIGAIFGWKRARERYYEYLDEYPALRDSGSRSHRLDARLMAAWTLLQWSLLGIFAGVLFAIWYLSQKYLKEQNR